MRNAVRQIAFGAVIVAGALVCALPWTAPNSGTQLPMAGLGAAVPAMLIFAVAYWRPDLVTALAVFLAGLILDVTTGGPLGYWPLLYLLSLALARFARRRFGAPSLLGGWIACLAIALLLSFAGWAIRSLYTWEVSSWSAVAWPLLAATLAFPIITGGLMLLTRWMSPVDPMRATRRALDSAAE